MRLKLVPDEVRFPFMRWTRLAVTLSAAAVLASIVLLFTAGLNFGIDFRGGTMIEARTPQPAEIARVRAAVGALGLGDVQVQEFGDPRDILVRVEAQPSDAEGDQMQTVKRVREALEAEIPGVEIRRVEVVGPKVSGELIVQGALAVALSVLSVLVYIWLRFEWQFSLGAVIALVHDVVLTMGVFSALQLQFNLSTIAALLTIVGYSLNDTVIVFDRVRENLRKYKEMPLDKLLDLSIGETLSRTLMTSGTTLLALLALYFLGGETMRGFTFAMIWGIVVGTYSSIFIAAAAVLRLDVKRDWSGGAGGAAKGPTGVNFNGAQV
ncbi:protein translocase subunit SecF [Oceanicella actignis]|uniref:Protein-export membrane protein SecF n=1 Tax=Oceanicella actignis TaxID=1189325 RepID=A0A1M7RVZ8_9RHOB|nr:protein translocase subunit SecF [Oceanicella actignis]TYO89944.1 protein translocase subunit secF [Oceanicella actignis]SET00450.1 protein translocase subunit secF [Oceanicella actignis]SHN50445.1 preprotein translocase subunit SecF [Oceanicella actignis]